MVRTCCIAPPVMASIDCGRERESIQHAEAAIACDGILTYDWLALVDVNSNAVIGDQIVFESWCRSIEDVDRRRCSSCLALGQGI